jgi:hypothetical protein
MVQPLSPPGFGVTPNAGSIAPAWVGDANSSTVRSLTITPLAPLSSNMVGTTLVSTMCPVGASWK